MHEIPDYLSADYVESKTAVDVLWLQLQTLQGMATDFGISDIFQDNGAKILQQLIYLNMKGLPGREGNDAVDSNGCEWELKSINIATGISGISTNHHLNHDILAKYKTIPWSIAIYDNCTLLKIYVIGAEQLTPFIEDCERKLLTRPSLNNPKISLKYIEQHGVLIYDCTTMKYPLNPLDVIDTTKYLNAQALYRKSKHTETE